MDTLQEFNERLQEGLVEETGKRGHKQYKILIPPYLFEELQQLAASRSTSVADLIRYSIKLYLTITAHMKPGSKLIIQEEGKPDQIIVVV
jgi:hypothetical protein